MAEVQHRKDTKAQADYGPARQGQRCGLCQHYRIGYCTMVEGNIQANMWCKHFKMRKSESR
ncbi:MAG: hypothetical protein J2P47_05710 [Acetobacteraceae bacterium]|nr:hypothetical protein [Acetobacteraceae bacterium]